MITIAMIAVRITRLLQQLGLSRAEVMLADDKLQRCVRGILMVSAAQAEPAGIRGLIGNAKV